MRLSEAAFLAHIGTVDLQIGHLEAGGGERGLREALDVDEWSKDRWGAHAGVHLNRTAGYCGLGVANLIEFCMARRARSA
jgi:hypothetical protein